MGDDFDQLLQDIAGCRHCEAELPLGPRPVVRAAPQSRLLIIGQAPGTKVHETGIPWNDPSGERLRDWLQLTPDDFYDERKIAIMPMGFCYPGKIPKGGDKPPRPECAPLWHDKLRDSLSNIGLTLLVGSYAQKHYLGKSAQKTMTENIRQFEIYRAEGFFPLPHPSWRTTGWMKKNPWFEEKVLPQFRKDIKSLLAG